VRLELPGAQPAARRYLGESGALETQLRTSDGDWLVTDFMPAGPGAPAGLICRLFSAAPRRVRVTVCPRPNYARDAVRLADAGRAIVVNDRQHLYASHSLIIDQDEIHLTLPEGEQGWMVLADSPLLPPARTDLERWLDITLRHWHGMFTRVTYSGPYESDVAASLRALRLLCHEESGGFVAAATTSLPEVPGGIGNWDYRYVWLRDAGMIISALVRLGGNLIEGERLLDFICSARGSSSKYPLAPFTTLDHDTAPQEQALDFTGYLNSRPVRIGNDARDQLQLGAFGNVLLAAKLIYQRSPDRPHWETVAAIADYLTAHWREPDHGMWEEKVKHQYTASRVIAACALDSIAEFSIDKVQAARWRAAVSDIRNFVSTHCLTSTGAYAVFAGSEDVDVSAALFPVWAYTNAGTAAMRATIEALDRDYSWKGLLYWRHLEGTDSRTEGAFLASTLWVAQYWIMRGDTERAQRILDAALAYANDLGLFAEEADPRSGRMLGNFPQTFVHAAFIGVVIDLKAALQQQGTPT